MTRQEASKIIEQYRMCSSGDCPTLECADCEYNHDPRKVEEAFLMAIDALESAQPEPEIYYGYTPTYERPLADDEIVPRLRDINAQLGGSYAIDRAIEIIEAVAERRADAD